MEDLQREKINEIGKALVTSGLWTLYEQSKALGLRRSTTWTIVKSQCKGTGLTAATINRMLGIAKASSFGPN
jgi:hypothetical protein